MIIWTLQDDHGVEIREPWWQGLVGGGHTVPASFSWGVLGQLVGRKGSLRGPWRSCCVPRPLPAGSEVDLSRGEQGEGLERVGAEVHTQPGLVCC